MQVAPVTDHTCSHNGALQIRLSEADSVKIGMPFKGRDGKPIEAVLSQQDFENLSQELFERARLPLDEACWQVNIRAHYIALKL